MFVSSVITAAGRNSRMELSQIQKGLNIKNKLLLPFPTKDSKETVIETTINNVLAANVDECIVVLGHFAEAIKEVVNNISDDRVKIVENPNINVGLSTSLLNGLKYCKNDFVLCIASDQPTITTKTFNNIINIINKVNNSNYLNYSDSKNLEKIISILRRKNVGILDTAEGLGMPFVANKKQLSNYMLDEDDNLNPILRKMFSDGFCFYGVKERNNLELININNYDDYNFVLNNTEY